MAPVVWGLDLSEIKFSKFKSSYMWNNEYYLRRTKFIVYQCALIFCVISESLGTAVLSDYVDGQKRIGDISGHRVKVYNDDYVGAGSYNIFAGVFVAFIFGAAFFFDLIWPERYESKGVRIAWKVCGVLAVLFHLASALTLTIITATHTSHITASIPPQDQDFWWDKYPKHNEAPLDYKHNGRAIAAVVFVWLGWCSVLPSCVLLFLSINHTEKGLGAKSKHARERDAAASQNNATADLEGAPSVSDKALSDMEKPSSISEKPPQVPEPHLPDPSITRDLQADGRADLTAAAGEALPSSERTP